MTMLLYRARAYHEQLGMPLAELYIHGDIKKSVLSSVHTNQLTNLRPWLKHESSKPEFSKTERKYAK